MKKMFLSALTLLATQMAFAFPPIAANVDLRNTATDVSGSSSKSTMALSVGGTWKYPMVNSWSLQTGMFYSQRNGAYTTTGTDTTLSGSYLDIPVHAEYAFNDQWSAYAGFAMGLKMSLNAGSTSVSTAKSMIMPLQFGGSWTMDRMYTFGAFYEMSTELADNVKMSSLGFSFGYMF